jgi:hypothetical protein
MTDPSVKRSLVDGVPVHSVVVDGPVRAALTFRVGRGDERAPTSGITHLVQHLALLPFGQQPYEYGGSVDGFRTVFVASGTPEEVAAHLAALCRNLAKLQLDRFADEQRALREEPARRPRGPVDHHAWLRWGLRGPGLAHVPEYGLWRLTAGTVDAWAASWFTAGNAALAWVGPEPRKLELPLRAGSRRETPALPRQLEAPAWAVGAPSEIGVSFEIERTTPTAAAQRILARRLQRQLRDGKGVPSDVQTHLEPLSATHAMSTIWATAGAGDAPAVRDVVLDAIRSLESDGPTDEELAEDLEELRRAGDRIAAEAEADRLAVEELLGASPETQASAHDSFRSSVPTTLLTQPPGVAAPAGWPGAYPDLNVRTYPGRPYRDATDSPLPMLRRGPTLLVGAGAVSIVNGPGGSFGIRYADAAVVVRHGDSGAISVFHENGRSLNIDPADWHRGEQAVAFVLDAVAPERQVRVDEDGTRVRRPGGRRLDPRLKLGITVAGIAAIGFLALRFISPPGTGPQPTPGGPVGSGGGTAAPVVGPIDIVVAKSPLSDCSGTTGTGFRDGEEVWWSVSMSAGSTVDGTIAWALTNSSGVVGSGDATAIQPGDATLCFVGGPVLLNAPGPHRFTVREEAGSEPLEAKALVVLD